MVNSDGAHETLHAYCGGYLVGNLPRSVLDSSYLDVLAMKLDEDRIKSWYLALTLAGFSQDEAMLKIAQAIHDGLLAS